MALRLVLPPTTEPVSLAEMKTHVRELTADLDDNLTSLIKAGREAAEEYQNRRYLTQTWELTLDYLPTLPLRLGDPPLQSLDFVKLYDINDTEITVPVTDFIVDKDSEPGRIAFKQGKQWPAVQLREISCFKAQFKVGFLTTDIGKIPEKVKLAIKLFVSYFLDNPDAALDDPPMAFYNLLGADRRKPI